MLTIASVGKGGVGKSTITTGIALSRSRAGKKVRLPDLDAGRSTARMLAFTDDQNDAGKKRVGRSLVAYTIDPFDYVPIDEAKRQGKSFDWYMEQFPEDRGLVAFCDMISTFFGCPTDVATTQKFTQLTELYHVWRSDGVDLVTADVEPTEGFKRLINGVTGISRSLTNLSNPSFLTRNGVALAWPDIAKFLQSSYIKQAAKYTSRMQFCAEQLRSAGYILVTLPEEEPIAQMHDVHKICTSFGGKVLGIVVNNGRGDPREGEWAKRITIDAMQIWVAHDSRVHNTSNQEKMDRLARIGDQVYGQLQPLITALPHGRKSA